MEEGREVWGSDRGEDTGIWGGVEGGTRVGDLLSADWRRQCHGAEGLCQSGLVPTPGQVGLVPPPGQVGCWLG